jgi:hypothetical protein
MYSVPEFNERLQEVFGERLRLRWSEARGEYHLEERVGRAALTTLANLACVNREQFRKRYDERVRADQGYALVMVIAPGSQVGCPECAKPLMVSPLETREVMCTYCEEKGRKVSIISAYFPIGEVLIDHLRRIDPLSDGHRRRIAEQDKAEQWSKFVEEKDDDAYLHDILFDEAIRQIPKVGYTGEWKGVEKSE